MILAKLGCFDLLKQLFPRIYISKEVYGEVVIAGRGLPGALEVAKAEWIEVKEVQNRVESSGVEKAHSLGAGEISTILLAKEIHSNEVLLDDYHARKIARSKGLQVRGTLGLLEALHLLNHLPDLRATLRQLLAHSYIDQRLIDRRLRALGLHPL